ncbi:MAG: hypothetical protein KIS96_02960 [Bauldia sp.]|nr:hypothetical protein [Bauldia sp.]
MLRIVLLAAAAAVVTGCASIDQSVTAFRPSDGDIWMYTAFVDATYPDNAAGEARRMEILERWFEVNELCQNGYIIDSREVVMRSATVGDVLYEGHCL